MKEYEIKGMAHITGGGFIENLPRMMPEDLGIEIKPGSWEIPPIFTLLEEKGNISREDMYNIFNMGIGMALVVKQEDVSELLAFFEKHGEMAYQIGAVVNQPGVSIASES